MHIRFNNGFLALILIPALTACGKKKALTPPPAPVAKKASAYVGVTEAEVFEAISKNPKYSDSQKAKMLAGLHKEMVGMAALDKREEKDRQELVLPAPPGWKPENAKHKLKLTLIPERPILRKGEKFRYCLEIQNVGQETYAFAGGSDAEFIKKGRLNRPFDFFVTPPDGKERWLSNMPPPSGGIVPFKEIHFPSSMTKAEKDAAIERMNLTAVEEAAVNGLSVVLNPGETIFTRPNPPPPNRFRDLDVTFDFDKSGTYRIKAVYDLVGDHPDVEREKELQTLAKRWHMSRAELLRSDERIRIKSGITLEQERKEREEKIKNYEDAKRKYVGHTESNIVVLEVVP